MLYFGGTILLGYDGKTSKQSMLLGVRFCLNTVVKEVNDVIYTLEVKSNSTTLQKQEEDQTPANNGKNSKRTIGWCPCRGLALIVCVSNVYTLVEL